MSEPVLVTQADAVCEVRLNRPEKRNAINFVMYEQLTRALSAAQSDAQVKAVLLSGAGACFSAGNDLQDFLGGPSFSAEHPAMQFLRGLATFGKPLLAAVHGHTVGIGVTLLLHCDLVVAAPNTQLSLPFVALGLVPEAGSSLLLPRRIGYQRAAELLFLGQPCNADTAYRLGLLTSVVEEAALLSQARALARTVAQQPQAALIATRRLLRGDPRELLERIEEEARIFGAQLQSVEFRARVQAFLSRGRGG
ncbi:MAG: enoyl-CoA hydratase/isomerase family protein [Gammaproteobacteria bacterium]|nr:enoyl-CoA hydratase/isomerase family protein [Gammaproteobacteria bacterium]